VLPLGGWGLGQGGSVVERFIDFDVVFVCYLPGMGICATAFLPGKTLTFFPLITNNPLKQRVAEEEQEQQALMFTVG
jgi:hypothetical protein